MSSLRAAAAALLVLAVAAAALLVATLGGAQPPAVVVDLGALGPLVVGPLLTPVTAALLLLVTGLGAVVAVYAARNLAGQARLGRFAVLEVLVVLGLAVAVTAGSLPILALGWTVSGLAISALVGHAGDAGARAAAGLVRRRLLAGDALLWSAVAAAALLLGTTSVAELGAAAAEAGAAAVALVAVLVVLAGVVRSALVPAHRWLPETTAAPSPVSALLHAGVVNGIGVLALLLWPLLMASPAARTTAVVLGAATALLATAQQRVRPDVKGRLVSSTSAQMGYLAICVGLGLPAAVLVHLIGHGLWKASLFLGAGGAVTRVRAAHAAAPTGRPSPATVAAAAAGVVAVVVAATVPVAWGPSLLTGPALLLPVTVAAIAAATALVVALRSAQGSRAAAAVLVVAAASLYVLAVRAVDHGLSESLGWSPTAWGEPGAAGIAVVVALLVGLGAVAWQLDRVAAAGRLPRLAAGVARTTYAPSPLAARSSVPAPAAPETAAADRAGLDVAVAIAADVVAPSWPLHAFVASNPLAGLEPLGFDDALRAGAAAWGSRPGIDAPLLRSALAAGAVDDDALDRVCASVAPGPDLALPSRVRTPAELVRALLLDDPLPARDVAPVRAALPAAAPRRRSAVVLRSPAEAAVAAAPRLAGLDQRCRDLVSAYAARVHGAPAWPAPGGVLASLHADAPGLDRVLGVTGAGAAVAALPAEPADALGALVDRLGLAGPDLVPVFTRVLARDPGWVAHLAWRARVGLAQGQDELLDLLVARLALESIVVAAAGPVELQAPAEPVDHAAAVAVMLRATGLGARAVGRDTLVRLVEIAEAAEAQGLEMLRLRAWEESYRTPLLEGIAERARLLANGDGALAHPMVATGPEAHVVTCIDVRSERLRRHLEAVGPWETVGAAGFFGLPFAHVSPSGAVTERLPALLRPQHTIAELPVDAPAGTWVAADAAAGVHGVEGRVGAPFALAEAAGWVTGPDAVLQTLAPRSWNLARAGLARRLGEQRAGRLVVESSAAAPAGFPLEGLVDAAEAFLRTTGLVSPAPVVLLVGHGATVANNPHVAAYDCGACGGQPGDVSARAMAQVLNDADVRAGLAARGIEIPEGTWFGGALHDTTRETVRLLDEAPDHASQTVADLMRDLAAASDLVAEERAALLPGSVPDEPRRLRHELDRRSLDWAQVRPEWGLARNAAIVIGPRSLTAGLDLDGRVFLHSYRPDLDTDGSALDFLLSAPLVVAQWISTQYWCSTVDPVRFGAGDKTTHNVVAAHDGGPAPLTGVLTGPRGDLRVGLPWQAVSEHAPVDGAWTELPFHEPLRLLAVVCAAPSRVEQVLAHHPEVARLVDGAWISLVVVEPETGLLLRRDCEAGWTPLDEPLEAPDSVDVPVPGAS